jgi:hypothetical protein
MHSRVSHSAPRSRWNKDAARKPPGPRCAAARSPTSAPAIGPVADANATASRRRPHETERSVRLLLRRLRRLLLSRLLLPRLLLPRLLPRLPRLLPRLPKLLPRLPRLLRRPPRLVCRVRPATNNAALRPRAATARCDRAPRPRARSLPAARSYSPWSPALSPPVAARKHASTRAPAAPAAAASTLRAASSIVLRASLAKHEATPSPHGAGLSAAARVRRRRRAVCCCSSAIRGVGRRVCGQEPRNWVAASVARWDPVPALR